MKHKFDSIVQKYVFSFCRVILKHLLRQLQVWNNFTATVALCIYLHKRWTAEICRNGKKKSKQTGLLTCMQSSCVATVIKPWWSDHCLYGRCSLTPATRVGTNESEMSLLINTLCRCAFTCTTNGDKRLINALYRNCSHIWINLSSWLHIFSFSWTCHLFSCSATVNLVFFSAENSCLLSAIMKVFTADSCSLCCSMLFTTWAHGTNSISIGRAMPPSSTVCVWLLWNNVNKLSFTSRSLIHKMLWNKL